MFTDKTFCRDVRGISGEQKRLIMAFMQGTVYAWIRDRPGKFFAVRDLMGGPNFEWGGTPLYPLYERHITLGRSSEVAIKEAGKDLGSLTKTMLYHDKRTFQRGRSGLVRAYAWVGGEP